MAAFRPALAAEKLGSPDDPVKLCRVLEQVVQPGSFLVCRELDLVWLDRCAEEIPWEIFRGRLVEPRFCRGAGRFLSWNIHERTQGETTREPLLAVKWSPADNQIHVVRGLLCHVWESDSSTGNVIGSREIVGWQRELVGTLHLAEFQDLGEVRDELICLLWQAVVGTSRLPLNSVETPLPAFTLGQLAYVFQREAGRQAMTSAEELIRRLVAELNSREQAKLLECILRASDPAELPRATQQFASRWQQLGREDVEMPALLRRMFNEVSLSPYTGFVDNALGFVACLVERGHLSTAAEIDFLSHLLVQSTRHLTAYDLVLFHHRGANYPDALMLEAVLAQYRRCIDSNMDLFLAGDVHGRRRRRALRQACLLRKIYEGHAVPDVPTSPGENVRVLPAPFVRVPEEQITQPARRQRQLFLDTPWRDFLSASAQTVFRKSLEDLQQPDELRELGLAVFIDRPLGMGKAAGEPDQTPLLAHLTYSPTVAQSRLRALRRLAEELGVAAADQFALRLPEVSGLPIARMAKPERPIPTLADAVKVAVDFVVLKTLGRGLDELRSRLDLACADREVAHLVERTRILALVKSGRGGPELVFFDEALQPRVVADIDAEKGFRSRAGVEMPRVLGLKRYSSA